MTSDPLFDEPRQACPTCRASYPLGVAVCVFCGCALPYPSQTLPTPAVPAPPPAPAEVFVEPERAATCAWCGLERQPDAERCPRCGAAFTSDEQQQAYANAALGLRMQAFRADAAAEEEGNRTARRWRWASWALGRIILRWPGNL
jgi:hypothetical protein